MDCPAISLFALVAAVALLSCSGETRAGGVSTPFRNGGVVVVQFPGAPAGDARAARACSPDQWKPPAESGGAGVQALLKDLPLTTRWADVPVATRAQLQKLADARLAAFRARWGAAALGMKQTILLECPTAAMQAAIDEYYRKSYDAVVAPTFSLKEVKSAALARALVGNYLGAIAAYRATLTYPSQKLLNRDWDGQALFDSVRLPDKQAYEDIRNFNAAVVADLRRIDDASLAEPEKALKQRALFDARALAVGAFSGDSFGGADMETACELVALNNDILQGYNVDKGRPKIFASDDDVLREVNALYLHSTAFRWLDVGTWASAEKLTLCNGTDDSDVELYVGNPATNDVAKGIVLLKRWWIERVAASADAQNKCSIYSAQDRTQIWEAFSADQRFNNDGSSSMDSYRHQLDGYRGDKIRQSRDAAKLALQQVFPTDAILTSAQRRQVVAAIDAETAFGLFPSKIAEALDAAQGTTNGVAATTWRDALTTNVETLGGNYSEGDPVRPGDEAAITAMYEEVKSWVASQYQGYPTRIESLFDTFQFVVTTSSNSTTKGDTGNVALGVGAKRSKMEYYSLLIHELRHAVNFARRAIASDKSKVVSDEGPAIEGSGVAVEALLLELFLKQTLKNDLAYALYALDYGIRDARFVATTDATLQKYFRSGCAGAQEPNTIDFAKAIAVSYGLTGALANTLAQRAHAGTQYFQYISGGLQVLDDIAYLQSQIDPSGKRRIDPFVLFACSLNNPRRTAEYVALLRTCMKL